MYYEPDTVWGRTIEGDEEVTDAAAAGCRSSQRRVLRELAAAAHVRGAGRASTSLEAPKLEHELIWLAERKLVAFQRPGSPQPRTAPRIHLPLPARRRRRHASRGNARRCPSASHRPLLLRHVARVLS